MLLEVLKHAMMITSFVLMMMLLIEYINVQTQGVWQKRLRQNPLGQYILGAVLGIIPGCLGAFTVVSLYSHRMVSFGTLAAAMIATSGDEAFVMLSMFPLDTLWLTLILFLIALPSGYLVDLLFKNQAHFLSGQRHGMQLHDTLSCRSLWPEDIAAQLKRLTFRRAVLIAIFVAFLLALFLSTLGSEAWNWKKITFAAGALGSLFVIVTVPEHFLNEHIYQHVIKKHLLRVFLWTFSALLAVHYMKHYFDAGAWLKENSTALLFVASLIGFIPESGPHMLFVTMYAKGLIPFAVLLASSISQDGHGTLPLLAVSLRAFLWIQLISAIIALAAGAVILLVFE